MAAILHHGSDAPITLPRLGAQVLRRYSLTATGNTQACVLLSCNTRADLDTVAEPSATPAAGNYRPADETVTHIKATTRLVAQAFNGVRVESWPQIHESVFADVAILWLVNPQRRAPVVESGD